MNYFVYELKNEKGIVEYVGITKNPEDRAYAHKRKKLKFCIIDSFNRKDKALLLEGSLKIKYNLNWTERIKKSKGINDEYLLIKKIQVLLSEDEYQKLNKVIMNNAIKNNAIRLNSISSFVRSLILDCIDANL